MTHTLSLEIIVARQRLVSRQADWLIRSIAVHAYEWLVGDPSARWLSAESVERRRAAAEMKAQAFTDALIEGVLRPAGIAAEEWGLDPLRIAQDCVNRYKSPLRAGEEFTSLTIAEDIARKLADVLRWAGEQ